MADENCVNYKVLSEIQIILGGLICMMTEIITQLGHLGGSGG